MCVLVDVDYASVDGAELPAQARSFVGNGLSDLMSAGAGIESAVHAAQLAVSELVTNSINAGATRLAIHMTVHRDHIRIAVEDDADGHPRPRQAAPVDSTGRGLGIIGALGRAWGVEQLRSGKQVWVDLPIEPSLVASIACQLATDPKTADR